MISASHPDGRNVTRNSSLFKKVQISEDISGEDVWEPQILTPYMCHSLIPVEGRKHQLRWQ